MMLTTLVFLELSTVFGSISYPILLHKLNSVDNSPETTKWFENYVTLGQSSIGFTQALPVTITHSVPQGAILLPLLSAFIRSTFSAGSVSFIVLCG